MWKYYCGSGKQEADSLKSISIFWLKKYGYLKNSKRGGIEWTFGNGNGSSVKIASNLEEKTFERVTFSYLRGDEQISQVIDLARTSCRFGGERFWFLCGLTRVGVLYYYNGYFACRNCHNLTYETRNLGGAWKGAGKIISIPDLEKLESEVKRIYYAGKPTKKYLRFKRKEAKFMSAFRGNLAVLEQRYS